MHTLESDKKSKIQILHKDGVPQVCPWTSPIILPTKIEGQISIQPRYCSSMCPLFECEDECDNPSNKIKIHCGNTREIKIEKQSKPELA